MMYILSIANVTFLCLSNSSLGNLSHVLIRTFDGVFLVVLPFNDLKLGPRMSSTCRMSALVMEQFGDMLLSTYSIKSLVLGRT